jgi:hypothetical protein
MVFSLTLRFLRDLRMFLTYLNKSWIDSLEKIGREMKLNTIGNSDKSRSLLKELLMLFRKEPSMNNREELMPPELLTMHLLNITTTNIPRISEDTIEEMNHG